MKGSLEVDSHPEVRRSCILPVQTYAPTRVSFEANVRANWRTVQFAKLLVVIFADVERLACLQPGDLAGVQRAACFEASCGHGALATSGHLGGRFRVRR
jgi:hypothetical protein